MVGIVERLRRSLEGGVVEPPLGRRALPDEFCEVTAIGFISPLAAIGGEVELVPPGAFGLGRQRHPARLLATDEIAAYRNERGASLGPDRRDDARGAGTPVATAERGCPDLERIHQSDHIAREPGPLAISNGIGGADTRRS